LNLAAVIHFDRNATTGLEIKHAQVRRRYDDRIRRTKELRMLWEFETLFDQQRAAKFFMLALDHVHVGLCDRKLLVSKFFSVEEPGLAAQHIF